MGGQSSFHHGHVKSLKKFWVRSWSVIPRGGQSSFDHGHVESLKKILGEILVCHMGGQSSFHHGHVKSLKKKF